MSEKPNFMTDKVLPAVTKFSNFKFVKAMANGIVAPTAATVVGSIIAILQTPPFPKTNTSAFVTAWRAWSAANTDWLSLVYLASMNFVAIYTLIGVVVATANLEKKRPVTPLVTSFMVFIILSCNYDVETKSLSTAFFGSAGLITAILVGYLVTEAVVKFEGGKIKIKLPDSVPPNIADALGSMLYVIIIAAAAIVLRLVCGLSEKLLPQLINTLFSPLFTAADSFWAVLLYTLLVRLFWFFGLHGGNIASPVMGPFMLANMAANTEAYAAGQPLPYIFTNAFSNIWTTMGMLPIAITILLFCKSKQLKTVGKIAVVPAFFCIGEPLTFGVPLVLNFDLVIPYMLTFGLNASVAYLATAAGLINRTFVSVPWTLPHFIKAFLTGMDYRTVILYFILLAADIAIMTPFMKKYDRKLLKEEEGTEANS